MCFVLKNEDYISSSYHMHTRRNLHIDLQFDSYFSLISFAYIYTIEILKLDILKYINIKDILRYIKIFLFKKFKYI